MKNCIGLKAEQYLSQLIQSYIELGFFIFKNQNKLIILFIIISRRR